MLRALIGAALACSTLLPSARAVVVFDNFGPTQGFDNIGVAVSGLVSEAVPFVPSADASVTDLTVALSHPYADAIPLTLSVRRDQAGFPGQSICSATLLLAAGNPRLYHLALSPGGVVQAGTTYWFEISSGGSAFASIYWQRNVNGAIGVARTLPDGTWVWAAAAVAPVLTLEDRSGSLSSGACCTGGACHVSLATSCNAIGARFAGPGTTCNIAGNSTTPCCTADFDQSGSLSAQDIFGMLNAWFAGDLRADIDRSGTLEVQDIFAFLQAWFAGCP